MDHPTEPDHDQALTRAWEQGDERGYEGLVTRYAPLVYARCRRALGAADADDATQAVFLVLARKRAQASACPALAAWLLTVADHVIRNARRDLARRRRAESALPRPHVTDEASMPDIQDHLDAALAELPVAERMAVQLHLLAGHTLAEVATHVGAPVSTVHVRVQRGLERLRRTLAGRGVTTSALLVVAALGAESSAAVPSSLLVRLRESTAAGGGVGAASVVSTRAIRWSQQGLSPMSKIAIAGSTLMLGIAATLPLVWAADTPSTSTPPLTTVGVTTALTVAAVPAEAGHAAESSTTNPGRTWWVLRLNDGARSAQRIAALPELSLLSAPTRDQALAILGSVRSAVFGAELKTRPAHDQAGAGNTLGLELVGATGWVDNTSADSPLINELRRILVGDDILSFPLHAVDQGWTIGDAEKGLRLATTGARIDVHQLTGADAPPASMPAELLVPVDNGADLTFTGYSDSGTPGEPHTEFSLTVVMAEDGMRLSQVSRWEDAQQAERLTGLPRVQARDFARIPSDSIVGVVMRLSPDASRRSGIFADLLQGVLEQQDEAPADETTTEPGDATAAPSGNGKVDVSYGTKGPDVQVTVYNEATRRRLLAVKQVMEQIDGTIMSWVQPGVPFPTWSLMADVSQAAAQDLITGLDLPTAADGSVKLGIITMGWRDGHWLMTTHPEGLARVIASGGFTDHADVQHALTAMPNPDALFSVILRPTALLTQVQSFAPILLSEEDQQAFALYQQQVTSSKAFGFINFGVSPEGMSLDAGGVLALIAGAGIAGMLSDSGLMLQGNN